MPDQSLHPVALSRAALLAECDIRRTRRSGPGGQHRNRVETAVILTHRPSGISAEANERRSQRENHDVALRRLRFKLAVEVRSPTTLAHAPSLRWQSRCCGGKVIASKTHDDLPALLAEALNVLVTHNMELRPTADYLRCSPTQLIKLLKMHPQAFVSVNAQRDALNMGRLK